MCVRCTPRRLATPPPPAPPSLRGPQVLKKPPYNLLEGDFVRAECAVVAAPPAPAACLGDSDGLSAALQHPPPLSAARHAGEGAGGGKAWRVLKKDEPLGWSNCVVKVMTNRRAAWQQAPAKRG